MRDRHWMDCLSDPDFDWRLLQSFSWLVESGSFRAAALASRISLNTLRGRIERLEHALGKPLVVRMVKGIEPTAEGTLVLAIVEAMGEARDRAIRDIVTGCEPNASNQP